MQFLIHSLIVPLATGLVLMGSAADDEDAGTTLMVLAEEASPALIAGIKGQISNLLATAKAGHRIVVVSGPEHSPVVNLPIPRGTLRERLRNRNVNNSMVKLASTLASAAVPAGDRAGQLGIPNLPNTYWSLAAGYGQCRIMLVGDPIYFDGRYPFWSFRDSKFPSDAAISDTRSACPFINRSSRKIPADVTISLLTPDEWGSDQRHRDHVIRWLRLAAQESLGGTFVRVTNSVSTAFGPVDARNSAFEKVHHDGRRLVGMWKLANGANQSGFPESDMIQPQQRIQDGAGEYQNTPSARDEPEPSTESPPAPSSTVQITLRPELLALEVVPESFESTATQTEESVLDAHALLALNPNGVDSADVDLSNHAEQPTASDLVHDVVTQTDVQVDGTTDDATSEPAGEEPPEFGSAAAASPSHRENIGGDGRHEPTETGSEVQTSTFNDVLRRIRSHLEERHYPEELGESLLATAEHDASGFAVVVTWQSACPHADVNLEMPEHSVRHDMPHQRECTNRDRIEWCITASLDSDCWINLYHTHRDVQVTVDLINLSNGTAANTTTNIGHRADEGREFQIRRRSPSWRQVRLAGTAE